MKRNLTIDYLRGIAMLGMILIHTTYYFLNDKVALFLWNWSQFAVPVFIFCSGYIFFFKSTSNNLTIKQFSNYLLKRLQRLVIPYYIFLIFFFPIIWITTGKLTLNYVLQSVFLTGGADINWLVLLMLELAIAMPIILWLKNKHTTIFWIYMLFCFCFSILSIFYSQLTILNFQLSIVNYKLVMFLGWSLVALSSLLFIKYQKNNKFLFLSFIISLFIFLIAYCFETMIHHDLSFYGNKYPPTIYILSYGSAMIALLYWLVEKNVFRPISRFLFFVSRYSYSIFFIHYCLLILIASMLPQLHITWYLFFAIVLGGAMICRLTFNLIIF